jgi:hypothetical protein
MAKVVFSANDVFFFSPGPGAGSTFFVLGYRFAAAAGMSTRGSLAVAAQVEFESSKF